MDESVLGVDASVDRVVVSKARVGGDAWLRVELDRRRATGWVGHQAGALLEYHIPWQDAAWDEWEVSDWPIHPALCPVCLDDLGRWSNVVAQAEVVEGEDDVEWALRPDLDATLADLTDDVVIVPVELSGDAPQGGPIDLPRGPSVWPARKGRVTCRPLDGRARSRVTAVPNHAASPRPPGWGQAPPCGRPLLASPPRSPTAPSGLR